MVQLQTTDPNKQDRSLILPILGEVSVPISGIIEVANKEIAALVVEANVGFELFEGSFAESTEDTNVASIIQENLKLKEQNTQLSLDNDSLKKQVEKLTANQRAISVVTEEPAKVAPVVVEKPKVVVSEKTISPEAKNIDIAAKIAAVGSK